MTIYLIGILNYTEVENVYEKQILLKYKEKNLKIYKENFRLKHRSASICWAH